MRRLIPYQTIVAAKNGDGEAMASILRHYANYIAYYSRRKYIDTLGNQHFDVNEDVKQQVEAKLVYSIVCKFDHTKPPVGETLEE